MTSRRTRAHWKSRGSWSAIRALRVTLYHNEAPGHFVRWEFINPGSWGDNAMNNPATDTQVEIESVTTAFAVTEVDAPGRTLTLTCDFGEGGGIIQWADQIGKAGTATHGKKAIHVSDGGLGTNYFGCFPIAIQHVTGFERDIKGKLKVVTRSADGKVVVTSWTKSTAGVGGNVREDVFAKCQGRRMAGPECAA